MRPLPLATPDLGCTRQGPYPLERPGLFRMESLVTFPLSRDEQPGGQNILNIYDRVKSAASNVISSFLPEDHPGAPRVALERPRERAMLTVNTHRKSQASVSVTSDGVDMCGPDPIPLTDGDHSDVESMFSTASYSLSKAYLATQYRRDQRRTLNSLGREFWMKDENAKTCFRCLKRFTTFRRRHHCRVCGQIFCASCTRLVDGNKFHQKRGSRLRCCANCLSSLASHTSSEDEEETTDDREHTPRPIRVPSPHQRDEYHFSPRSQPSSQVIAMSPGIMREDYEDEPRKFYRSRSNTRSSVRSLVLPPAPQPVRQSAAAIFPSNRSESITLNDASLQHLSIFLERVLMDSELLSNDIWKAPILDTLLHLAGFIRVDIGKERTELKDWVKLKCIPGGQPSDIESINGIAFTHNFVLRDMPHRLENPRVLLISFPLEYSRGSQYMSLNPVLAQESEYLKKLVARIKALEPTVLLSSSNISGLALKLLQSAGIAVATGIRSYALERLARYMQTEPLASMDRLSMFPTLGTCDLIEIRTYRQGNTAKSFMFFTGMPTSGSTVLLRGEGDQTKMVKTVMDIMLDIAFSLKMETYLMRDQFVSIPEVEKLDPSKVLSSSPFVNFGMPYLQSLAGELEDKLVECNTRYSELSQAAAIEQLKKRFPNLPGGDETLVKIGQAEGLFEKDIAQAAWMEAKQQWEQLKTENQYMFNPGSHQNIIYSFFLYCNKTNMQCVGPETSLVDYYLDSDIPLGMFVENCCSTFYDPCPDGCPNVLGDHTRCYYHANGMLKIKIEKCKSGISGLQETILMWNRCKICDQSSAYAPMSANTWRYSFGKYMELSFWSTAMKIRAGNCQHNIYRDYVRHFGWHDMSISVEYQHIDLFDVHIPDHSLRWPVKPLIDLKISTYTSFREKIIKFWDSVISSLANVKLEGLEEEKLTEATQNLQDLKESAEKDREECLIYLEGTFAKIEPTDYLGLNIVLRFVQSLVTKYHTDLSNFDALFSPSEKDIRRVTVQQLKGMLLDDGGKWSDTEKAESERDQSEAATEAESSISELQSNVDHDNSLTMGEEGHDESTDAIKMSPNEKEGVAVRDQVSDKEVMSDKEQPSETAAGETTNYKAYTGHYSQFLTVDNRNMHVKSKFGNNINLKLTGISDQLPKKPSSNKVGLLARHFEELSKEFELERQREQKRIFDRQQASAIRRTQPVATVFKDANEAAHDGNDSDADNEGSSDTEDEEGEGHPQDMGKTGQDAINAGEAAQPSESLQPSEEPSDDKPKPAPQSERKSLIQSLVDFWAERSSTRWSSIEYIMKPNEHIFSESMVIIREDEPSSLIAFCLSVPDYKERVERIYSGDDGLSQEQVLLKQKSVHLKYNFVNGNTTMSCKIFFSEQFDALRKQCKCATNFVQSLSRCNPWQSSGGKSGSAFLKTADDRFILKSISQSEFDSFTNFAPSYFNYMSQALFHDLPTALTKMFGVYQVHFRNGSSVVRMYLVLTENLFTGGNYTRFFDLKGSMRNRKAAETGKANEVLLDENMVDYIYKNPVYVREHSKRRLTTSIYNDTLFLTKMNVMDYSLIIGIDEENNRIVAGIIDYIRAFTWDKKVESWVKGRATQGAKEPTVVSPKQYKVRFRESMAHYFLLVPDCWHMTSNATS